MNGWHIYGFTVVILLLCMKEMTWTRFFAALAWPCVALVLTIMLIMTVADAPREDRDAPLP